MSTIKKIIQRIDRKISNAFDEATKMEWIAALDGKIALNVMLMAQEELEQFDYSYPEDLNKTPLVKFPFDDLYDRWVAAQIDAHNEEWDRYANSMEYYNAYYEEFVNWFLSTYRPGQGDMGDGSPRPGLPSYYLTAYGLAIMQGFRGTLEEWFASLKGEKGDKGDPGAKIQAGTIEILAADAKPYAEIVGTLEEPVLNLGIPKMAGDFLPLAGGTMRGPVDMAGFAISGLPTPAKDDAAATKAYAEKVGMVYRGTTADHDPESTELPQGLYQVTSEINGVAEGVLLQWQLIPGTIGVQMLINSDASRIWLRTCWTGVLNKWRYIGFDYGDELPKSGVDGQLYFVKV